MLVEMRLAGEKDWVSPSGLSSREPWWSYARCPGLQLAASAIPHRALLICSENIPWSAPFPTLLAKDSDYLGVWVLSVGAFQKLLYMFILCLLQSGLTIEKQTVHRLAFLTKYDILALSLLISLVLGIPTLEARQFMSIKNTLSLGFCPYQRTGDSGWEQLACC